MSNFVDRLSDYSLSSFLVDKHFRLFNSIRSRINALIFQRDYCIKYLKDFNVTGIAAVSKDIDDLSVLCSRLVLNSLVSNEIYLEVMRDFKKYPRKMSDHAYLTLGHYVPRRLNLYVNLNILNEQRLSYLHKGLSVDHIDDLIDLENKNVKTYIDFIKRTKARCLNARKAELKARLWLEMMLRVKQGWFIIFDTLTVENSNHEVVFGEKSTVWKDYIRLVDRSIGIKIHGNWLSAVRARSVGDEFHTYFAVIERGSQSGRLHIHVLHFMKVLPENCVDPNVGRGVCNYREITGFKRLWRCYGYSTPIAVRFNNSDAYAKIGWRWPVKLDEKSGMFKDIDCKRPDGIVHYMGKYLTKEYNKSINKEDVKWRVRVSQNLGKTILKKIIKSCSPKLCELILRTRSTKVMLVRNHPVPMTMIKRMAMRKLLKRFYRLTPTKLWNTLLGLKPLEGIMTQVRAMIAKVPWYSPVNTGVLMILDFLEMGGFELIDLFKKVELSILGVNKIFYEVKGNSVEFRI